MSLHNQTFSGVDHGMQLKTILNRVQKHRGFVYEIVSFVNEQIEVELRARKNSKAICSKCERPAPGYDTLDQRRFEFVPLWNLKVFFLYAPRRVDCRRCGVKVEKLPWSEGKHRLTRAYAWFLATWAKRMSWSEVAQAFHTSWDNVFRSVEMAVQWGRKHMDMNDIKAIGIDEIQWHYGSHFLTVVYQIDEHRKRLLWVGDKRRVKTLLKFFHWFGKERSRALEFICSDMWRPYLKVITKKASQAVHILDRFHIMSMLSKAIDQVRAGEARELRAKGYEPVLTGARWLLLKRPERLTDSQDIKLRELLQYNLRSVRSYLLKEDFQFLWKYSSPYWAGRFLDGWCTRVMRSRIEPMKRIARSMRNHRPLILNWFRARGTISAAAVEGFNNKAKLTTRKAFGFRTFKAVEVALFHTLGDLPEPEMTHRFC
jgi:transposase